MSKEIVESTKTDLLPILDPQQAKLAYQAYLELCQAILVPYDKRIVDNRGVVIQESDYARIKQSKKDDSGKWVTEYVDAPKKSAFRKLGKFYGISTEILEKNKETHDNASFTHHYTVKAIAPNGVYTTGEGSCTSSEKGGKSEHDTRSTAHTRAKSRAISDLIGFGQVSAEEYGNYDEAASGGDFKPPKTKEDLRKEVEAEFKEKDGPVWDGDLSVSNIQAFLIANGFDGENFKIRHDEPSRMYVVDSAPWTDDFDLLLSVVKEMGGEYNRDHKKTVFRY